MNQPSVNQPSSPTKRTSRAFRFPHISLRFRLLIFLLGFSLISFALVAYLAYDSVNRIGANAQQIGGEALTRQVKTDLEQFNAAISRENDQFFSQILSQAKILAKFVSSAYEQPLAGAELGSDPLMGLVKLDKGQYGNSPQAVSSFFVPNFVVFDDRIRNDVRSSAELEELFPGVREEFPSVVALFYATPNEATRYYPNINLGAVLPENWKVTSRPWYLQATNSGKSAWVDPYLDATGKGLVTTAAIPVLAEEPAADCANCPPAGSLLGVIGMDVTLDEIKQSIETNTLMPGSSYSFLIDSSGRGIVMPDKAFQDILGQQANPDELLVSLVGNSGSPDQPQTQKEFQGILQDMQAGKSGLVEVNLPASSGNPAPRTVIVAFAPLKTTGWSLGTVIEPSIILQPLDILRANLAQSLQDVAIQRFLPSLLVLGIVILVLSLFLTERWIRPIRLLVEAAVKIGRGQWDVVLPGEEAGQAAPEPGGNFATQDEIQVLSRSFQVMKNQIYDSLTALEDRVSERTRQLERRSVQLQTAADLARDITQTAVRQPGQFNALLTRAIDLISERFGFYHAGIFLVDSQGEFAVLRAATGETGKQMLAQGHRLRIGTQSAAAAQQGGKSKGPIGIVGYVAETGTPRIALDTGMDVVHFKNPLLVETRSEMALPLISAGSQGLAPAMGDPRDLVSKHKSSNVIGVLDVQSKMANAFDDQDIAILQILADQLAVAIENARIFQSYQNSLQELESLYTKLSADAWKNVAKSRNVIGYELLDGQSNPITKETRQVGTAEVGENAMRAASASQPASPFIVPVKVRGETVAKLEIWPADNTFSSLDQKMLVSLSDHLSQALESARLFEETQARAFREQAINEFVASLSRSLDLETLMKSAVRQLGALPNVSEVTIEMSPETSSGGIKSANPDDAGSFTPKPSNHQEGEGDQ